MRKAYLWALILLWSVAGACVIPGPLRAQSDAGFAAQVAARCKGEASWAIALCACVVRNRLAGGWNEDTVLSAFYAADVTATAAEIDLAQRVLTGQWPCDPRLYFQLSADDCRRLGLPHAEALVVTERDGWTVKFYGKDAFE